MRCTTIKVVNIVNIVSFVVSRNVGRLVSSLLPQLFPCHHIGRVWHSLVGSRLSGSSLDLALTVEGIHWALSWNIVLRSQLFLVRLEDLAILIDGHALAELFLELIHSISRGIYHIRLLLLRLVV